MFLSGMILVSGLLLQWWVSRVCAAGEAPQMVQAYRLDVCALGFSLLGLLGLMFCAGVSVSVLASVFALFAGLCVYRLQYSSWSEIVTFVAVFTLFEWLIAAFKT